jgi:hypothetical protein
MTNQQSVTYLFHKLGGYYLIPHELLHVFAYRIIDKPCHYRWGDYRVQSSARKSRREKLFVLLFPFIVCWGLGFFFHILWFILVLSAQMPPEQYFFVAPKWHFAFPVIATLCILYSGTAHQDLIDAYRWLFKYKARYDSDEPHHQAKDK